jgi:4-hydroxy-tetrahydrodipicolinate reductase
MTTKIAVSGASGRMGQAIIRQAQADQDISVRTALENSASLSLGQDAGTIAGLAPIGVEIVSDLAPGGFDVLVEFTTPAATMAHLTWCLENGCAMMIGTTGMSDGEREAVRAAGDRIPVVLAANTSVGVNLCVALLETAARVIGSSSDVEVIESHHRNKVDAPSGTALLLGETVARTLGKDLSADGVFSREGITGARMPGSIGFSTIRGGDIAGEHTVMFIGDSERVEITHRASDRRIFASGALRAVKWLAGQPPGFYDMRDVLGLH